jgi:hypothetical protein
MRSKIRFIANIAPLAITICAVGCHKTYTNTLQPSEPIRSEQLRDTDVVPHAQGPMVAGRNYLYCATFQLAWNRLQNAVLKEPVHLSGAPPMAEALVFGSKLADDILPPGSYLVKAGLVKDGVVRITREEMKERFPNSGIQLPSDLDEQAAVTIAYLRCSFKFREAFDLLDEPLVFRSKNGSAKVASFGVRCVRSTSDHDKALAKQVTVLARANDEDFILRLNTTSDDDELILARVVPAGTLSATLAAVAERIKRHDGLDRGDPTELLSLESLIIPIIDLDIWRSYSELQKRSITDSRGSKIVLAVAEQGIRFRLDEKGARLESSAHTVLTSTAREQPAKYILNKPFLVMLKRRSCDQPYFACWVETPELLKVVGE